MPEIEKIEGDDFKEMTFEEMAKLSSWVHLSPSILKQGTIKHAEIEHDDEDTKKRLMEEQAASDPYEKRLRPISLDKSRLV